MKRHIILLLVFALGVTRIAAQSEAEFIKLQKEFTINPSGQTEARYIKELKLLTHRAMNNMYGETFIVYDPRYQELKIHEAYTRQADGTIMKTPDNAYNEVLPAAAANAPAYNHLKEMVVTHTGLELGATIYLDYSVITQSGYHPYLDIAEPLQELSPIKSCTVTVKVPAETPVHYTLSGLADNKKLTQAEGVDVYFWEFRNIPANSREPYQPICSGYAPYFTLNTYESQEKAFSFINYSQDAPDRILKKLTHIDKTSQSAYINAAHGYITKDMDYSRLSIQECGRSIRPLQNVVNSGYGTSLEKAVLMKAVLDYAKISSELAVLYARNLSDDVLGLSPVKELGIVTMYEDEKVFIPLSGSKLTTLSKLGSRYDVFSVATNKKIEIPRADNAIVTTKKGEIMITADSVKSVAAIRWDENGYAKFTPKEQNAGINDFNLIKLASQRISYLELPYKTDDTVEHNIVLSPGIECKTLPQEVSITNKAGQLQVSVTKETGRVIIRKQLKLNKNLYAPAEYADLKKLIRQWYNPNVNTLILYKEK
ncbi:DUF3857 domain-containing protein [Bacteroides sp. OttesenSCG-928-D19]|nr:DUF3857 domain-containing protein [Bacteroides sp. OttesenSCG-928-D19]